MTPPKHDRERDLHPADRAARLALRDQMVGLRRAAGLTQAEAAAMWGGITSSGITASGIGRMETRTNWQIRTLQTWARQFGHQLHVDLCGLVVPDDGDPAAAMYAAMNPTRPEQADELAREVLVNNLARIRRGYGWTLEQMADQLGVTHNAVRMWEDGAAGVMLAPAQRFARALGGHLVTRLESLKETRETTPVAPVA